MPYHASTPHIPNQPAERTDADVPRRRSPGGLSHWLSPREDPHRSRRGAPPRHTVKPSSAAPQQPSPPERRVGTREETESEAASVASLAWPRPAKGEGSNLVAELEDLPLIFLDHVRFCGAKLITGVL